MNQRPADARLAATTTAAIALLVYLATAGGSLGTTDAVATYEVTRSLVHHGSVALPDGHTDLVELRGPDGRYFAPFGIGQSLYNIPFYLAGLAVERATGGGLEGSGVIPKAVVAFGSTFTAAGCVWVTALFGLRLTERARSARFAALSLAFSSALWPYSKFGFNAPLVALCLIGGLYAAWRGVIGQHTRLLTVGGALLAAALLTRHEMMLAAATTVAWTWWASPRDMRARFTVCLAVGPSLAVLLWGVFNQLRFGNPLYSGYRPGLGVSGFAGLLVSPGGSIFLYSPIAIAGVVALVWLWRRDLRTASLLGGVVVVLFTFYASLDDWLGTRSYGPRYLVPLLPLLCVPIAPLLEQTSERRARALLVTVALLGGLVQLPGVLVDVGKVNEALRRAGPVTVHERRYDWSVSALVLNAERATRLLGPNIRNMSGATPRPSIPKSRSGESLSQRLGFSLDFWWLYLWYLGLLPRAAAFTAAAVLVASAVCLAWYTRFTEPSA